MEKGGKEEEAGETGGGRKGRRSVGETGKTRVGEVRRKIGEKGEGWKRGETEGEGGKEENGDERHLIYLEAGLQCIACC